MTRTLSVQVDNFVRLTLGAANSEDADAALSDPKCGYRPRDRPSRGDGQRSSRGPTGNPPTCSLTVQSGCTGWGVPCVVESPRRQIAEYLPSCGPGRIVVSRPGRECYGTSGGCAGRTRPRLPGGSRP